MIEGPAAIPYIKVVGDSWERGYSLGRQGAGLVKKNIEIGKSLCCYMRKVSWETLLMEARRFDQVIRKYDPDLYTEMEGIAAGAEVSTDEIIFLNVRTELMNAVWSKAAAVSEGCTSVFVGPGRTLNHKIFAAQTWDWTEAAKEVIIMLDATDPQGHQLLMITEAGVIGSMGINNRGIAVLLNYLPINEINAAGTPYHLLLRRALDSKSIREAQCNVLRAPIAFGLNIIIGDANGQAIDMELTAKGTDLEWPEHDLLAHTNHLLSRRLRVREIKALHQPSVTRLKTVHQVLGQTDKIGLLDMKQLFAEHRHKPFEICKHAAGKQDACTIYTVIFELKEQKLYLSYGLPCQNNFITYDLKALFRMKEKTRSMHGEDEISNTFL